MVQGTNGSQTYQGHNEQVFGEECNCLSRLAWHLMLLVMHQGLLGCLKLLAETCQEEDKKKGLKYLVHQVDKQAGQSLHK